MYLTVFAGRLGFLWTAFQPPDGVVQQIPAIVAQLAFPGLMPAPAGYVYELLQYMAILFPSIQTTIPLDSRERGNPLTFTVSDS